MANRNVHTNNNSEYPWSCALTNLNKVPGMDFPSTSQGSRSRGSRRGPSASANGSNKGRHGDHKNMRKVNKLDASLKTPFNPGVGIPGGIRDPLKHGLSGPMQKRYVKFLKKGYTPIVARQMAIELKRIRHRKTIQRKLAKEAALKADLDDNAAAPDNMLVNSAVIQLAVLPISYPNHMLIEDELPELQEIILNELLNSNSKVKIKFNDVHFRPGMMIVDCCTNESVQWLQTIIPKLGTICCPAWRGPKLITCTGPAVPKTPCITFLVPECDSQAELKRMLALINAQNDDLNIRYWKILMHNKQSDGMVITVAIDELSLNSIKANNLMIHYKFGIMPVHVTRNTFEDMYIMCKKNKIRTMSKKEWRKQKLQYIVLSKQEGFSDSDSNDGENNNDDNDDEDDISSSNDSN